ncbi:acyl transferase [Fulvivirga ligni]|uniref:acyl transferase n=1 Tax=Fulvivirga ligni TaxID=2904246 RepID=UPI001F229D41|nr:acyl transferase [Fulvivirga ligni]UII23692.1 acyl transferase [Fulvivirga ligni]
MNSFKSFSKQIFDLQPSGFETLTLEIFKYQAENNEVYKNYLNHLKIQPKDVNQTSDIPFLPISFFKTQNVITGSWQPSGYFESSGTTGQSTSKHAVYDEVFYLKNTEKIFNHFYGPLEGYHFLALLPAYLERTGSSLVLMADYFIKESGSDMSGFYLNNLDALVSQIEAIRRREDGRQIVLLGVSFALLDLAEEYNCDLSDVIVMETGGMKGRRKEMIRAELHQVLKSSFNTHSVHSEYGMTELMSQAYSDGDGKFKTPPWMRIVLRDLNDPFDLKSGRRSGGINVIDLANFHSCAFIETQDIGSYVSDDEVEILGRFDNSDIRGCNLMVS